MIKHSFLKGTIDFASLSERAYSYNEHRFERDLGGKWNVANHWVAAPGVVTWQAD